MDSLLEKISLHKDEYFMRIALREAERAFDKEEVPIGCIIVYKNRVIAKAHNQVETLKDSTAHAEMIAITQAENFLGSKWLKDCTLYVTIEPCVMCASALILCRIDRVIFGAREPKMGGIFSLVNLNKLGLNHKIEIKEGILKDDCVFLLKEFFRIRRKDAEDNRRYP